MKKFLSIVLALMLVLSMAVIASAEEERLTITWVGYSQSPQPDQERELYLEERFNVNLEFPSLDAFDEEQFNLWLSGGGEFDVLNLSLGANQFNTCVEQGLARTIPVEWLEQYMPTWMEKAASLVGGDVQTLIDQCSVDGELYAVPLVMANFMEPGIFLVRQDWLDNLGLSMPTNVEEFHDMLYAFTYNDPDGNGVDDTYGMNGNGRYYFNYVFGAYGIMKNSYYVQDDGSVVYTNTTEEFKEVMKLLQSWYKEGIIDPETITDDRTKQREKWGQGLFGVLPDNASWCSSGVLQNMVTDQNPNAVISYMPAFEGCGSYVDYPSAMGNQGAFMFGYDTTDEECIKIMEIKEAMASDSELYDYMYFGTEGVHYEKVDGYYKKLITDNAALMAEGVGYWWGMQPKSFEEYNKEVMTEYVESHSIAQANPFVYHGKNFYVPGENEANTWYGADVATIADTFYADALMGNIDIDEAWDGYLAELSAAGLDDIISTYEEMLAAQ